MELNFKVTLIGTLPPIKGISPYCKDLLTSLSKHVPVEFIGFKKIYPDFLYPGGKSTEDDIKESSITIENTRILNFLTYYNPLSWVIAGLTCKGDIIHAQWWSHVLAPQYFIILSICRIRRKKVIITIHNVLPHEEGRFSHILNNAVLRLGDVFVVHSDRNISQLCDTFNIPRERVVKIPMGTDANRNTENISQEYARKRLSLPKDKQIILFFGHIRLYKGLDVLLEAFNLVIRQNAKVHLVIAGYPWKNWDYYDSIIKNYHLGEHCTQFLNFIPSDDTKYYFSASDIVVLPYREFMSQSAVGADALAYGKPLIVSDVGGLPDFVKDRRVIVQPNNPKELAESILSIIENRALLTKLSEDSRELREEYSWENVANKTLEVYRDLVT